MRREGAALSQQQLFFWESSAENTGGQKSQSPASQVQGLHAMEFADLAQAHEMALACRACSLCEARTNVVFADGNASARLMVVGEGPGLQEDRAGLPFVGQAGQMLGTTAVQTILKVKEPLSQIRGKWFDYDDGAKLMPVYHPSYLLRNDSREPGSPKWHMWQDIQEVRRMLDMLD